MQSSLHAANLLVDFMRIVHRVRFHTASFRDRFWRQRWRPDDRLPANTSTGDWAVIPSEQYAEATIELVLGKRPIPTPVRVTREAIRIVEEWAAGD